MMKHFFKVRKSRQNCNPHKVTKAVCLIGCAIFLTGATEVPRKKMAPKHNTGGYINVGTVKDHRFSKSRSPRPLKPINPSRKNEGKTSKVLNDIHQYLKAFPATTAVLLLEKGEIVAEIYQGDGTANSEFYSMSIGKSMASLAVGQAYCNGLINDLNQKASEFIPEMSSNNFGKSSVRELLMMSSGAYQSVRSGQPEFQGGIGWSNRYNRPYKGFSWPLRLGQVTIEDILWGKEWKSIKNKHPHDPGEKFIYKGADTLALSKIVERVSGVTLAQYYDKHIWQRIGAEYQGHWESDKQGSTIASSGFQASLRDWGRIALWILEERKKPGCYGDYLKAATTKQISIPKKSRNSFKGYGYQWWTNTWRAPGFWGLGYAGQILALNPKTEKILIKFSYRHDKGSGAKLMKIFKNWN
ncbi:MAG: beta-lactamase family protein [Sneathiellales bacterium]|nr:beta-lactamase family protein [Sneathiellales bacterium]